jgi:hypothetical protein
MDGMKYIMYDRGGIETPILFPQIIDHDSMAMMTVPNKKLISAGFVSLKNGVATVAGHSHSLSLKSRPEDSRIIQKFLTWEGF